MSTPHLAQARAFLTKWPDYIWGKSKEPDDEAVEELATLLDEVAGEALDAAASAVESETMLSAHAYKAVRHWLKNRATAARRGR